MSNELNKWVKLTQKGQVTIPKPIREKIGAREGERVRFRLRYDGAVVVETAAAYKELSGKLNRYADKDKPVDAYKLREKRELERTKELGC